MDRNQRENHREGWQLLSPEAPRAQWELQTQHRALPVTSNFIFRQTGLFTHAAPSQPNAAPCQPHGTPPAAQHPACPLAAPMPTTTPPPPSGFCPSLTPSGNFHPATQPLCPRLPTWERSWPDPWHGWSLSSFRSELQKHLCRPPLRSSFLSHPPSPSPRWYSIYFCYTMYHKLQIFTSGFVSCLSILSEFSPLRAEIL